ncbi:MAG: helix-turn-helix transcriptional regulator [Rhodomicrobium sp.]|jgi:transcriptional regulator with XRE-family HTH domain
MSEHWSVTLRQFRLRHGLTQVRMAALIGVPPRAIGRWERAEDEPAPHRQRQIRDLAAKPDALSCRLLSAISACALPRALTATPNLRLQTLSRPAIDKRPTIVEWIGRDLAPIADGVLAEMLGDSALQRSIAKGEVFCIISATKGVLRTEEQPRIGVYRTTTSYFFHDGTLYNDAISVPAPADTPFGYRVMAMDDVC